MAIVFINGLFTGGALNYTLAHLLHLTLPETHYIATSLLGTFRGFAGSFGSAIGGGIFARALRSSLEKGFDDVLPPDDGNTGGGHKREELVRKLIGSPLLVYHGDLSEAEQIVAVRGYTDALRVLFQSAVVLTAFVIILQAAAGWKGPKDKEVDREEGDILEGDDEQ